ncbi:MAG: hypothetical protein K2W96_17700 [Gemmataceae bacterium]|nr:hypothetical protein [Gemmataceae bacterium]
MADMTLAEFVKANPYKGFSPKPLHSVEGDFVSFFTEDADALARRIDDVLTVYESGKRLVGVKVKQVARLIALLGDLGFEGGDLTVGSLFVAGGYLHAEKDSRRFYQHFMEATKAIPLADALRS